MSRDSRGSRGDAVRGADQSSASERTASASTPHLAHVAKTHVVGNERQDLLGFVIGKPQPAADLLGDTKAHLYVPVKTYAIRRYPKGRRLAYVVEQSSPGQSHRYTSGKSVE